LAELVDRYREVTVMAFPPVALQRVLISPLARLQHRREARRKRS
jgi:hypothetical protein